MATGQTLLDTLETLSPELQLQSGEADVSKGLNALNRAQDLMESIFAQYPDVKGGTVGTVTTTADTETTAFPSDVLRIDKLQYIDPDDSLPKWNLEPIQTAGGHSWNIFWPLNLVSTVSTGKPKGFWTNGTNIYWDPIPDATHTVRWYGFQAASDISAGGTFAYDDVAILPICTLAAKIILTGLNDPVQDFTSLAEDIFRPLVESLTRFNRTGPKRPTYTRRHMT